MKTNTDLSIEIMYRMKEFLNNEIRQTGEIKINNKKIWDGWLHKMDNTVWRGILSTLAELEQQHPHLFTLHQSRGIEQGLALLDKYDAYYDNVLDMKNKHVKAKGIAWNCMHTVREVWNLCVGENLPNLDSSRITSTYGDIFE